MYLKHFWLAWMSVFAALTAKIARFNLPIGIAMSASAFFADGFLGYYLSLGGLALVVAWALDQRQVRN